jgi:hypothetical protein
MAFLYLLNSILLTIFAMSLRKKNWLDTLVIIVSYLGAFMNFLVFASKMGWLSAFANL